MIYNEISYHSSYILQTPNKLTHIFLIASLKLYIRNPTLFYKHNYLLINAWITPSKTSICELFRTSKVVILYNSLSIFLKMRSN